MRLNRKTKTDPIMDLYCSQLLLQSQNCCCSHCENELIEFQLHHKRYGLDITLYDLELLCPKCHGDKHNLKKYKSTPRLANDYI